MNRELEDKYLGRIAELHQRVVPLLKSLSAETDPTIISEALPKATWVPLDLSVDNPSVCAEGVKNPLEFHDFIFNQIAQMNAQVGYGGVFENRGWYQRSDVFGCGEDVRNLHIGLDLWCRSDVSVVCPIDGVIHSFQNNDNFLDYGPTIILEHRVEELAFYSLYGHLSIDSLAGKKIGQQVYKGQEFGRIGSPPGNGGWPPHLHFQLMLDLLGKIGDFPGVCSPSHRTLYELLCPSPLLLLMGSDKACM